MANHLRIGTCSWKYDSWTGLVYADTHNGRGKGTSQLREYCRRYNTVEVDQWFWSLFPGTPPVLPKIELAQQYADVVPDDFLFTVKVPNSITLTHYYSKGKAGPLKPNPHFLSVTLFGRFLQSIAPLNNHLGPLIFQFEYLNKQKMAGLSAFLEQLSAFFRQIPKGLQYGVEIRNPNYLTSSYAAFLAKRELIPVFLQGYYMPSAFEVYTKYESYITRSAVFRLHGGDRKGIEERTGEKWDKIVDVRDKELEQMVAVAHDFCAKGQPLFINVNNHYEGSAPLTIERLLGKLSA